ncbi:MAG TPA: AMP-binding protein, partial [Acidimicrobiales bacterium]|nr:AMP-binding protein [Acidimicrobiales bacterium]
SGQPRPGSSLTHPRGLAAVAAYAPDRAALVLADTLVTYGELDLLANRLAQRLVEEESSLEGSPTPTAVEGQLCVPILIEGSKALLVAIEAVRRAGMVVVPIDPNTPALRIDQIAKEVGATFIVSDVITDLAGLARIDPLTDSSQSTGAVRRPLGRISAITFTSGSTGEPKGIVRKYTESNAAADFFWDRYGDAHLTVGTVLAGSLAASISVVTIFIDAGWTLVPYEVRLGTTSMAEWLRTSGIKAFIGVPTVLRHAISGLAPDERLSGLDCVGLFGEGLTWEDVRDVRRHIEPDGIVFNFYGSSEAGQIALLVVDADTVLGTGRLPVGGAVGHVQIRIVDDAGQDIPAGEIGQIAVRTRESALRYWNDPDASSAVFHDLDDDWMLIRTGDAGRIDEDGQLELRGRLDQMVKIGGNRVDLAEIEAVLRQYYWVTDAVAATYTNPSGEVRIQAFVVTEPSRLINPRVIRGWLRQRLPRSAVPDVVRRLDELPRLSSGKVNRAVLPAPETDLLHHVPGRADSEAASPEMGDALSVVLDTWRETLGMQEIDPDDDFFDVGGDSLRAVSVASRLSEATGTDLPLWAVLEEPTPRRMAELVAGVRPPSRVVSMQPIGPGLPLFVVHDILGNLFGARHYLSAFRLEQPVYGFRPSAWDAEEPSESSLEELAARYVEDACETVPRGAMCLFGPGSSNFITFEVARQLERRGRTVALLIVGIGPAPYLPAQMRIVNRVRELRRTRPRDLPAQIGHTLGATRAHVAAVAHRMVTPQNSDPTRSTRDRLTEMSAPDAPQAGLASYGPLIHKYRPAGYYHGPTMVIVPPWTGGNIGRQWAQWVDGPFRVVDPDTISRELDESGARTFERLAP